VPRGGACARGRGVRVCSAKLRAAKDCASQLGVIDRGGPAGAGRLGVGKQLLAHLRLKPRLTMKDSSFEAVKP